MAQLENIEAIEKRLWSAADNLRANSNYASNEYFMPVMGLIFLRHAYSRYLAVKGDIEAKLPKRGGKTRALTKEDFSQKGSIYLRPEAEFDFLVALPDSANRAKAIQHAMETIEEDYEDLKGVLPLGEYAELDNAVLGQLLRTLNPEELKQASGDIFGRIYEYFLTQFADQKAHDGGEFFTPVSIVQLITNVIEPDHGKVFDPACGSGGMFVQSAHFVERMRQNPRDKLTFYGLEKNATTIRLAKMNLAVHGLGGNIQKAISYYEDPHELVNKADFVMANPPFNVDEVDADKIKNDPRLKAFGLPGVNNKGKVSNGNYLWISYFHSYLNAKGRAGFVMSSQASSAGRDEAKVRQKIVETGDVDVMISIRSNFFYTRTVPCELWFFDRDKPKAHKDQVLMLDARNIYRKVTRKIYDFSPEQMRNLSAIVWLYRGQKERYLALMRDYLGKVCAEGKAVPDTLAAFEATLGDLRGRYAALEKVVLKQYDTNKDQVKALSDAATELRDAEKPYAADRAKLLASLDGFRKKYAKALPEANDKQHAARKAFDPIAEAIRGLIKQVDLLYKHAARTADAGFDLVSNDGLAAAYDRRAVARLVKQLDEQRKVAVEQLKQTVYFHRQVAWLQDRFPKAELQAVPGLVKLVDRKDIAAADWSLTPGRYVGVAPPEEDEDFDFEQTLSDIHTELADLNKEAVALAKKIQANFEELGAW
jgi:type I restriction enzyme M protein